MTKHRILASALILAFAIQGLWAVFALSPTFDEQGHLASGYYYYKTADYTLDGYDHPPLGKLWCSIPMLVVKPRLPSRETGWKGGTQFDYSFTYLFRNRISPELICESGRVMMLIAGIALGIAVYAFVLTGWGQGPALTALFLFCFCPSLIANSALVTTDLPLSLFFFLSVTLTLKAIRSHSHPSAILAGAVTGLALASKYSGVVLFPVLGGILCVELYRNRKALKPGRMLAGASLFVLSMALSVLVVYGFVHIKVFLIGLHNIFTKVSTGSGFDFFLAGKYSSSGWRYYFAAAFLFKTPIPLLLLIFAGSALGAASLTRRRGREEMDIAYLLWAALFFTAVASMSRFQIGLRHILPAYPLLIAAAAPWGHRLLTKNRVWKGIMILLFLWYGAGTILVSPDYIAYFNEASGGPSGGYKYLVDSNIDWGQGLKSLGKYLKKHDSGTIYFSYFGTGDPGYYGIKYIPLAPITNVRDFNSSGIVKDGSLPRLIAVSATNLQGAYYGNHSLFALLKARKPVFTASHSILVYDISRDAEARRMAGAIRLAVGDKKGHDEEFKFADTIDGGAP